MPSKAEQASFNIEHARDLRTAGLSYREIRRELAISPAQLSHIRRALKREKGARTRLINKTPDATSRDIPVRQTILSAGLRDRLVASGFRTLGDIADKLADPEFAGLGTISGIGPHRSRMVRALLDYHELLPGSDDLQASVEKLFPELGADRFDGLN